MDIAINIISVCIFTLLFRIFLFKGIGNEKNDQFFYIHLYQRGYIAHYVDILHI